MVYMIFMVYAHVAATSPSPSRPHTDHFWWIDVPNHPYHPNKGAPRCLPCHYRPPPGTDLSRAPATVPYGCPCTPERLCELDPDHRIFNKYAWMIADDYSGWARIVGVCMHPVHGGVVWVSPREFFCTTPLVFSAQPLLYCPCTPLILPPQVV